MFEWTNPYPMILAGLVAFFFVLHAFAAFVSAAHETVDYSSPED